MITVTRKDVMSSALLTPGWYPLEVTKVTTKPANSDGSTNFIFSLKPLDADYADVRIKDFLINEKGIYSTGMAFLSAVDKDLIAVFDKLKKKEVDSVPIDENRIVGKKIKGFVANTKFENRISNECTDFLPLE